MRARRRNKERKKENKRKGRKKKAAIKFEGPMCKIPNSSNAEALGQKSEPATDPKHQYLMSGVYQFNTY